MYDTSVSFRPLLVAGLCSSYSNLGTQTHLGLGCFCRTEDCLLRSCRLEPLEVIRRYADAVGEENLVSWSQLCHIGVRSFSLDALSSTCWLPHVRPVSRLSRSPSGGAPAWNSRLPNAVAKITAGLLRKAGTLLRAGIDACRRGTRRCTISEQSRPSVYFVPRSAAAQLPANLIALGQQPPQNHIGSCKG